MARLTITKTNGDVSSHKVTPLIEYAFEIHFKKAFYSALVEDGQQTYLYWLAWKCLMLVEDVKPFGENFLATLEKVVLENDDDPKE